MAKRMMDIGLEDVLDGNGAVVGADLKVANGDFVVEESTIAHMKSLLRINKGELKEYPTRGVGVVNYLDDDMPNDLLQEIAAQLRLDGMDVQRVAIEGGIIKTDAFYK